MRRPSLYGRTALCGCEATREVVPVRFVRETVLLAAADVLRLTLPSSYVSTASEFPPQLRHPPLEPALYRPLFPAQLRHPPPE